jgi:restriction system protein
MATQAGYEYLLAYKITVPIYDYTVIFCKRWIPKYSRTYDQMEQASRSGTANVAEGYMEASLKGYIYLTGVARASQEELLKDYLAFARQNKIAIWTKEKFAEEIREIEVIWEILKNNPTLPNSPNFPDLPYDLEKAINLMITLINQANYLLDKLISSLQEKHTKEGGFTENLYRKRIEYRNKNRK